MQDGSENRREPVEDPRIQDESAEYLDKDRGDNIDEDEEFDEEDWDDAWDEDDYRDRQDRDSGMRRHRARRRDSDDPLWPAGA